MSAGVVWRPRLKRRLARASSGGKPMAVRTCDGSTAPEEQAAPVQQLAQARAATDVQSTDALWRVQLVSRNGEQINLERVDVDGNFAGGLHGVGVEIDIGFFSDAANFFERLNGAKLVVGVHDGDE